MKRMLAMTFAARIFPQIWCVASLWLRQLTGVLLLLGSSATLAADPLSGIDRSGFDASVRPQDDLFLAANGGWLKATPIPPDRSAHGLYQELGDRADARVRAICEELAAAAAVPGSIEHKVGAFYRSHVDEAAIDASGLAPLQPWLAQIDALKTHAGLAALWGRWQGVVGAPASALAEIDPKDPGTYRAAVDQSGLGLPDRDYYLKRGEVFAKARAAYLLYMQTLLHLAGDADAAAHARSVLALETRIAQAQWPRADSQDALKTYNPMTLPALARLAPGLDWAGFFMAAAMPRIDRLSVMQPSYAVAIGKIVRTTPLATWRHYQRVRLFDANAQVLPKAWREAEFSYRGRALRGQELPRPRWQHATAAINDALGEAVGQVYVARHFPPQAKARMQSLVDMLFKAYGESIDTLTWMTPATKKRAREKLARYTVKIGYPETWRDYSNLDVRLGDAFGNRARAGRHEHERWAARVGKPVDAGEWEMTPQTVNAYYNASRNEIVFPAAILDIPFFDMNAEDAVNYGATGATIGHEISHGFDDQGSRYDGRGKLHNWWTAADRRAFDALGSRLVKQFDGYEPVAGHRVNGKLTLGENIADLSGLEIAYKAYQLSLKGRPSPVIDGMTGDERFFFSYAISWREQLRKQLLVEMLTSDEHAPSPERANGSVMNLDAFHITFGTRRGDRLYKPPAQRIRIW